MHPMHGCATAWDTTRQPKALLQRINPRKQPTHQVFIHPCRLHFENTTSILSMSMAVFVSFLFMQIANIVHLLSSYDAPVSAPNVPIEPMLIKKLPLAEMKRTALRTMQSDFRKLIELSRIFHMDVQELSSLDSMYKEMFRNLHENKVRKECREIRCSSIVSSNSCKGSLFVTIDVSVNIVVLSARSNQCLNVCISFAVCVAAISRNKRKHPNSARWKSGSTWATN